MAKTSKEELEALINRALEDNELTETEISEILVAAKSAGINRGHEVEMMLQARLHKKMKSEGKK
jgi:hypothetical protein